MDPMYQGMMPPRPQGILSAKYVASIVSCIVVMGIVAYFILRKSPNVSETPSATVARTVAPAKPSGGGGGGGGGDDEGERKWNADAPEAKLANFAFEHYRMKNYVPDVTGKIVRKPAGNPPYKLVGCESSAGGYAIRWNGMYLVVDTPNRLTWVGEKQEPGGCFKLVPGYCGGGNSYVMLRSMANKLFVRIDGPSNALVCKDTPTGRTAADFCWKLQPDTTGKQPCGQIYSYDLGKVIDVPCNVVSSPAAGKSCSTVTPGYHAQCCMKKGVSHDDKYCTSIIFPQVVGQSLQQALLYIRTRRPDLTLKPCPSPCTMRATPIQNPKLVVVPYDARSNIVTSVPYVLI